MKKTIAFLLTFISLVSFPEIKRSNLGAASSIARSSAKSFENPYITDGLVAMFDGEWNAGFGKHNLSATSWKDLVSG